MRVDELQQEIDELAIQLKQTIDRMMPEQQRLFNEKKAQARNCIALMYMLEDHLEIHVY